MTSPAATFLGIGELLWDCFPDQRLPGGAPANVAFHARQLGLASSVVTRVGCDPLGDELIRYLQSHGLPIQLVQRDPHHPTSTVTIFPAEIPLRYEFLKDCAWDFMETTPAVVSAVAKAQAMCFGTLAQRSSQSQEAIHAMLEQASHDAIVMYDINLRPPFYDRQTIERSLAKATHFKLNDDEVAILRGFGFAGGSLRDFATSLFDRFPLKLIAITRGANGCFVATRDAEVDLPGKVVQVVDTVGAGDAFTAALIWSQLAGWPIQKGAMLANHLGGLVASRPGAMPDLTTELPRLVAEIASQS